MDGLLLAKSKNWASKTTKHCPDSSKLKNQLFSAKLKFWLLLFIVVLENSSFASSSSYTTTMCCESFGQRSRQYSGMCVYMLPIKPNRPCFRVFVESIFRLCVEMEREREKEQKKRFCEEFRLNLFGLRLLALVLAKFRSKVERPFLRIWVFKIVPKSADFWAIPRKHDKLKLQSIFGLILGSESDWPCFKP